MVILHLNVYLLNFGLVLLTSNSLCLLCGWQISYSNTHALSISARLVFFWTFLNFFFNLQNRYTKTHCPRIISVQSHEHIGMANQGGRTAFTSYKIGCLQTENKTIFFLQQNENYSIKKCFFLFLASYDIIFLYKWRWFYLF